MLIIHLLLYAILGIATWSLLCLTFKKNFSFKSRFVELDIKIYDDEE